MSFFSRKSFFSAALLLSIPLFAQTNNGDAANNPDRNDMEALRRWIQDKRMVTVKEIGGDLSLSGEVRAEFQDASEFKNGLEQRRIGSKPPQAWDVEVNIMIDYRTDRTWTSVKLEFDNDMGISSGKTDKIRLEKAYAGGRIIAGDTFTWDAELGRRSLGNVYDSKVEFGSLFDGFLLRFSKAFEEIGNFYLTPGLIIVNDNINHYAYVTELGALQVANTGFYVKSSAVYWYKHNRDVVNKYRYCVLQLLPTYQFYPDWLGKRLIKLYAAGLCNIMAKPLRLPEAIVVGEPIVWRTYSRQRFGWYAGFSIGLIKKAGDFAFDTNFQWVQAQAVPDFDATGIGRGNAGGTGLYTVSSSSIEKTTASAAVGNGNYYGFEIDGLYAFTNNLTMEQNIKLSWTLDRDIGPNINYRQWEVELIYAF